MQKGAGSWEWGGFLLTDGGRINNKPLKIQCHFVSALAERNLPGITVINSLGISLSLRLIDKNKEL